ncbi:vesicle-associated membrane protein 4-like [Gigantopelta aegis]|uniref:vesicle-associated membrane protein 4-like n=1 Tax=Gigantopelta aegis TaxID=1735272 RepID=UPI001B88E13E|nr:vesicle-associated membrane protein 4-like [Gigantopelta aegis]XP_041368701.1 vesicle-associated membrane protein 4-like [Gigantopelta aegis]
MPPKFARMPDRADYASSKDNERVSLLDDHDSDEDFFLRGPSVNPSKLCSDPKLAKLQNQVDDVVDVMKSNVGKVLERGEKLEDLQDKSDSLAGNSDMFRSRAKGLHRTMYWKNCRMKLILALIVVILLAVIIIPIIIKTQQN